MMFGCSHEGLVRVAAGEKRVAVDGGWRGDFVVGGAGVASRTVVFVETGAGAGTS